MLWILGNALTEGYATDLLVNSLNIVQVIEKRVFTGVKVKVQLVELAIWVLH